MQWEMFLLLILALPFTLYYSIRFGIGRLKKSYAESRTEDEIAVGQ